MKSPRLADALRDSGDTLFRGLLITRDDSSTSGSSNMRRIQLHRFLDFTNVARRQKCRLATLWMKQASQMSQMLK